MLQEDYEKLKARAREAKLRAFDRKLARDKEKMENTLFWAIKRVKEEARADTWCTNHENCYRHSIGKAESDAHARMKFERFLYWRNYGASVFTEVRWKEGGGRSDLVVCLNNGEIFIEEIAESEKEESLLLKEEKYPFPMKVIRCDSKN